jgi:hypothetical protein
VRIDMSEWLVGRRGRHLALVLCLGLLSPSAAWAQADAATVAVAEKLFEEGRALMEAQRYEEACPRLAESARLDPATGTLLNLAECFERTGRIASAWATYRRAETAARRQGHRARLEFATEGFQRTAKKLAFLTVDVAERTPGLVVKRDEEIVGAGSFGVAVPVDPGSYVLSATAEGHARWKTEAKVGAEQRVRVEVPALAPAGVAASAETASPNPGGTQRVLGWVFTGVGAVAVGVGLGFGLVAKSKNDEARRDDCTPVSCSSRGDALIDDADRAATISTVLVAGGAAFAVGGIVLVLTAPRRAALTASVRGSMLELGGSF